MKFFLLLSSGSFTQTQADIFLCSCLWRRVRCEVTLRKLGRSRGETAPQLQIKHVTLDRTLRQAQVSDELLWKSGQKTTSTETVEAGWEGVTFRFRFFFPGHQWSFLLVCLFFYVFKPLQATGAVGRKWKLSDILFYSYGEKAQNCSSPANIIKTQQMYRILRKITLG